MRFGMPHCIKTGDQPPSAKHRPNISRNAARLFRRPGYHLIISDFRRINHPINEK
jgi:hypothetical protein